MNALHMHTRAFVHVRALCVCSDVLAGVAATSSSMPRPLLPNPVPSTPTPAATPVTPATPATPITGGGPRDAAEESFRRMVWLSESGANSLASMPAVLPPALEAKVLELLAIRGGRCMLASVSLGFVFF